ncbi:MAG: hypothetical protein Harvfovirus14_36 [Harvfovirus sp.]|uniref:Uncharacterized protein n=1 Tax=Harvfovirus sp. TaxID=2487768 RepID=A0A3G5A1H3_9VIRU|nr:MAG: hypothetical protein Harvfovirus14_36 [Harvfovirus sp.]
MRQLVKLVQRSRLFSTVAAVRAAASRPLVHKSAGRMGLKFAVAAVAIGTVVPFTVNTAFASSVLSPEAAQIIEAKATVKKYHDDATHFIQNELWDKYLLDPKQNLELFKKTLEYALYCQKNVPELKPLVATINFQSLILTVISQGYIETFDECFGFDNVDDIVNICTFDLRSVPTIYQKIIPFIRNEDSRKQIVHKLANNRNLNLNDVLFAIIQKTISESKTKIIDSSYPNICTSYEKFQWFASKGLIDGNNAGNYISRILILGTYGNSTFSGLELIKVVNHLLALNPNPEVKKNMTLSILKNMNRGEENGHLSFLVDKIGSSFTKEEFDIFSNEIKNQYPISGDAFLKHLASRHPKLYVVSTKTGIFSFLN